MAFGQRQARVNTDRFGNAYQLKTAYQQTDKQGNAVNSFKCSVQLGGKVYRIEVSERQKETKSGVPGMWVKVTALKKQQAASM